MTFRQLARSCALALAVVPFMGLPAAFAQAHPSPQPTPEGATSSSPAAAPSRAPVPGLSVPPSPTSSVVPSCGASAPPGAGSPGASPAGTPTATPRSLGLRLATQARATFVDRSTQGPGQVGPEAAGFAAGGALAPNTPYDYFSSAPEVPGVAGVGTVLETATYRTRSLDLALTAGLGYVRGSVTNAAYWSENLLPTLNPHLGSQALPYAIAFPTQAGGDDGTAVRLSLLSGSVGTGDGRLAVRAGWFDLAQTARFVFTQPLLTNVNPAIAFAPAESLAPALAGSDVWSPDASALPLRGIDVVAKSGDATLELANAALPSLPGEAARISVGSLAFDRGEGTTVMAQAVHVTTSGLPFVTTVPFGNDPAFTASPQGVLPTSTLDGQRQTLAGVRATFHVAPALGLDGLVQVGRAWYDAQPVARPGTSRPGGYYQLGLVEKQGRVTASLDLVRAEPRYATAILPYGVPEAQWSTAFAWPGQWLKSNYQLADNALLGVNRQGYRLRYYIDGGPLEARAEYTDLRQIDPETTATSTQSGFVDGFYLPEFPSATTFGRQKRYAFWTAWHPSFGDLSLDVVDDELYRPFVAAHPEDRVSYEVSQAVATFARRISPAVVATTGLGRYALEGAFAEPLDVAERLFFAGAIVRETAHASVLVSFRRTAVGGRSTFPAVVSSSPDFTGSGLVIEQRASL